MGFTRVAVDIANVTDPSRRKTLELLVDTGAIMTVVPATMLAELGITPVARRQFKGFGGVSLRRIGGALFTDGGDSSVVPVTFGEADDTPVLGVTTLEALGYEVDPVYERLVRVESLLL